MAFKGVLVQVILLPVAWLVMLYFQQDSMIYMPRKYNNASDASHLLGFWVEALSFETREDGPQTALILRPKRSEVLRLYAVFGGNAMLARDWIGILGLLKNVPKGVAFLLVDYPGFGDSSGAPSKASIKRTSESALREAERTLDELQAEGREGIGDRRKPTLGVIGHSIGCAVALELVASRQNSEGEDRVQHAVLSAPFTSIVDIAGVLLPVLKMLPRPFLQLLTSRHAWDNVIALERIAASTEKPRVQILHGDQDEVCPYEMGKSLSEYVEAFEFPYASSTFESAAGVGHNDVFETDLYMTWLKSALSVTLD